MKPAKRTAIIVMAALILAGMLTPASRPLAAGNVFSPEDALSYKRCYYSDISPEGKLIAYLVLVPRSAVEKPGGAYSELHLVSVESGESRPFITGKVNVSSPRFSPDGSRIAFLTRRRENARTQVRMMPVDGGEPVQVTFSGTGVSFFRWRPDGNRIAYIATTPKSDEEKDLDEKGYGFIFFEENLRHRNLFIAAICEEGKAGEPEQLTEGVTVWDFEFSPDGSSVAAAISPKNLIDHRYMFRKVHIIDLETKELRQLTDNPGKLGSYAFSSDGRRLVYTAAGERKEHSVSQLYVIDTAGGDAVNLAEPGFRGQITWARFKDGKTILYMAEEGAYNNLYTIGANGKKRTRILDGKAAGVVFFRPSVTRDFRRFAIVGTGPDVPGDVYCWKRGSGKPKRLTILNPWISDRRLGRQKVVTYTARDGLEIEGILVYPVDYREGERYPLIVAVHGGPESHYTNRWLTGYFNPAQVLAGRGYVVFYPNYRASTGYGVDFGMQGYEDPAGREFDDVADGIDFLVKEGIADPTRVGLGGGSYGGFAAAWFSSFYTRYVRAACMFVGISDLISKRGTTDIPYEELYVHSGEPLEKTWERSLKRSPIYWAHQSRTAVLILGGTNDTRVHPSQSLEYYRRLKMNNHPAVRWVKYPGEGHGNRKQPGRIDVLHRHLTWYDWYVKDLKPLDGPMPSLEISSHYGLVELK